MWCVSQNVALLHVTESQMLSAAAAVVTRDDCSHVVCVVDSSTSTACSLEWSSCSEVETVPRTVVIDVFSRASVTKTTQTRNSSGDEIANVNFLYDDIVHARQNTIDSCIDSATDRRGYVSNAYLPNSMK